MSEMVHFPLNIVTWNDEQQKCSNKSVKNQMYVKVVVTIFHHCKELSLDKFGDTSQFKKLLKWILYQLYSGPQLHSEGMGDA